MMRKKALDPLPYLAGAGIGALEWFALATSGKTLGVTTPFENTAATVGEAMTSDSPRLAAYIEARGQKPKLDWEWMLVAGIPLGAYLAARSLESPVQNTIPQPWARRFGNSTAVRYAGAFMGGALMMFGARMAKGCTSGHCISGNAQLSVSSWLFSAVMGATALGITRAVFGEKS